MNEPVANSAALAKRGEDLYRRAEYVAAAESFAQAAAAFKREGQPTKAAEMANNQAVTLLQVDRAEEAIKVLNGTAATFEAAGERRLAAQAHGNMGQAFAEAGQTDQARLHYQQAMELFQQLGDKENLQHTAKALSRLQLNQGDAVEALFTMQRGLEQGSSRSLRDRVLRWLLRLPSRFLSS